PTPPSSLPRPLSCGGPAPAAGAKPASNAKSLPNKPSRRPRASFGEKGHALAANARRNGQTADDADAGLGLIRFIGVICCEFPSWAVWEALSRRHLTGRGRPEQIVFAQTRN